MKRFVMLLLVFAIVVPSFADDAKPKSQLYGKPSPSTVVLISTGSASDSPP